MEHNLDPILLRDHMESGRGAAATSTRRHTTAFHPLASRLHHAASGTHPIVILDDGRAAIVCRIRAALVHLS
jgi:hypothetical protein